MAAFCVTVLHVIKFWLAGLQTYSFSLTPFMPVTINGESRELVLTGGLRGSTFDLFYGITIDKLIAFLSIFVIYHSESTLDVVLNSLAAPAGGKK